MRTGLPQQDLHHRVKRLLAINFPRVLRHIKKGPPWLQTLWPGGREVMGRAEEKQMLPRREGSNDGLNADRATIGGPQPWFQIC